MIDHKRQLEEAIFRAHQRIWRPMPSWEELQPIGPEGGPPAGALPEGDLPPGFGDGGGGGLPDDGVPGRGRPAGAGFKPGGFDAGGFGAGTPQEGEPGRGGPGGFVPGPDDGYPLPDFGLGNRGEVVQKSPPQATKLPVCAAPEATVVSGPPNYGQVVAGPARPPRTWYLAPMKKYHTPTNETDAKGNLIPQKKKNKPTPEEKLSKNRYGNNSIRAFDPSTPDSVRGSDLTGTGRRDKPFATLNPLLYPAGVEPNTTKTWPPQVANAKKNGAPQPSTPIRLQPGDTIVMLNGIYDLHLDLPASQINADGTGPLKKRTTIAVAGLGHRFVHHPRTQAA